MGDLFRVALMEGWAYNEYIIYVYMCIPTQQLTDQEEGGLTGILE